MPAKESSPLNTGPAFHFQPAKKLATVSLCLSRAPTTQPAFTVKARSTTKAYFAPRPTNRTTQARHGSHSKSASPSLPPTFASHQATMQPNSTNPTFASHQATMRPTSNLLEFIQKESNTPPPTFEPQTSGSLVNTQTSALQERIADE
ncbi:unnamed protein product [Linum trigynum]|uniref:Uncharacterized protein n=1 Tax=Linum trigynum TaxID=586398 RepID=A0AAV2DNF5_9ROSI